MNRALHGTTAPVTGAAQGLGRAIALAMADTGADLVLHTRRSPEIEAVAAEVRGKGVAATVLQGDFGDDGSVAALDAAVGALDPAPGILVNNVGIRDGKPFGEIGAGDLRRLMAINFEGPFFITQAAVPGMRRHGGGVVINIGGLVLQRGFPVQRTHLVSLKAALWGFTRSLAAELAQDNIRVNMISPGYIKPATSDSDALPGNPMGRASRADEVAAMVVSLCGKAGAYVTGQTIEMNGGAHFS